MCVYIYIYTYVCVCVYIYIYISRLFESEGARKRHPPNGVLASALLAGLAGRLLYVICICSYVINIDIIIANVDLSLILLVHISFFARRRRASVAARPPMPGIGARHVFKGRTPRGLYFFVGV